jgi:D-alanine-D-alanine ligase
LGGWREKLFVDGSDPSLRIMNLRWPYTEKAVDGMLKVLAERGVEGGTALDLCCGNGRISVYLAKRGFRSVGVDFSRPYIEDTRIKAVRYGVAGSVKFVEGDVRNLKEILGDCEAQFDVVVSAWTSIGYTTCDDDLSTFGQARELSREGSLMFIIETEHEGQATQRGSGSSLLELEDMVMLEKTTYDPITAKKEAMWTFYRRRDRDLEHVDELSYRVHVYSLPELSWLLGRAGWKVEACYGNIASRQAFSPHTGMNIVALATP